MLLISNRHLLTNPGNYIPKKYAKGLDNREYVVARYSPPGNFMTQFHTNIEAQSCSDTCSSTDYANLGNNCGK